MDSNEEYENEEETLVLLEVQGIMETDFLSQIKQAKAMNLGSDKPMFQLDDYTFSGEYQDTMGTCMFFEEQTRENQTEAGQVRVHVQGLVQNYEDLEEEGSAEIAPELKNKELKYKYRTNKKISVERIFINQNPETSASESKGADKSEGAKRSEGAEGSVGSAEASAGK